MKALLINGAVDLKGSPYSYKERTTDVRREMRMPPAPNPIQGYGRVDLERSLLCIPGPAPGDGKCMEVTNIEVGKPWHLTLDVPVKKPMLRVTMAYTDPPGNVLQDQIILSAETQDAAGKTDQFRIGDIPQSPEYEKPPPVYKGSNVQKLSWNCGRPKVVLTVMAATLVPTSKKEFALCYFFSEN